MQASVVQALKSLQLATVVQGRHPLMAAWWQTAASQVSVVQALWSSQSVSVVQQPTSWNGYTAIIRVYDPRPSYGYYSFDVSWRDTYARRR